MQIIKTIPGSQISIGRQGEHQVRQVRFDLSAWLADFDRGGGAELIFQRPGDSVPFPVETLREGEELVWNITEVDTANAGTNGKAELRYYLDGALLKSAISPVTVDKTLDAPGQVPEAPGQGWLDQALQAGAEAKVMAAKVEEATKHAPRIGSNTNWQVWDAADARYEDTGVCAVGPQGVQGNPGPKGDKGDPGQGAILDATLTQKGQAADAKAVGDAIGNLDDLNTTDKSSLVAAINEVLASGGGGTGGGDSGDTTSHGVIWDLVNVTSSNNATSVSDGASLAAVLTPADGYTLGDVTITMGGEVVTDAWNADTAAVTIASVTGDVMISCAGVEVPTVMTETLSTMKVKSSGWPTAADNGDGTYKLTFNEAMSDDPATHVATVGSVYWTIIFPGEIAGGELAVIFNKPVTSGAVGVVVFAVDATAENAVDATNKWVWSGDPNTHIVNNISENTTLQMPDGTYPLIMVRNASLVMDGDESGSNQKTSQHIFDGDITFTVTGGGSAATTTLSVDDDYAMDYGISTLSLVTDDSANTSTGIDSAYAAVIEEAKNAWMLEANGDVDKIPLVIHTDQHGHMNSSNKLFEFLAEIVNWYDISKVINLGDTVSNWIDSDTEHPLTDCAVLNSYLEAMADVPYSKRIEIFGNHDTWDATGGGTYQGIAPQNCLHKYFRNIYARRADNYGNFVVKDDNYNVKYVVVSGFAYDSELGGYTHYVMHPDSIRWAIAEMEKVDGYDVILLSHVPLNSFTYKDMDALWSGRKTKTSGTVTDEYGNSYAFDFTKCDGELLCALHGHNHEDGNAFMGDLLYAWVDGILNANACHFLLVDRANRQLNVWKVDSTPQYQNYRIALDKPAE